MEDESETKILLSPLLLNLCLEARLQAWNPRLQKAHSAIRLNLDCDSNVTATSDRQSRKQAWPSISTEHGAAIGLVIVTGQPDKGPPDRSKRPPNGKTPPP
jgi:hypothetical protein